MTVLSPPLEFTLSDSNTATSPPEHRGVARDRVRLMAARPTVRCHRASEFP